jgi:hypothetical protein
MRVAQRSPVSSDGLQGLADRSQPSALSCLCECVAPLATQRMPGQKVHVSAAASSMNHLRHHAYAIGLYISRVSVAHGNSLASRLRCERMEAQRLPAAALPARHRRHSFPIAACAYPLMKSLAPWPNGRGIGLRSWGLQVRGLPGSLLYYVMFLGKRAFIHMHATGKSLLLEA